MVTGFSSPVTETHGESMKSRDGFDTQTSFHKDKPILGCHFDIALMHKYHFLKSIGETQLFELK